MVIDGVRGDVLVVSPHLDDAVLSCEAWIGRPDAMDVVTVFCGRPSPAVQTDWDRRAGFEDSDDALACRLAEDDAAFAGTPHRRHRLDLVDGQYLVHPRSGEDAATVCAWIDGWLDGARDPLVLIPVGAGLRPLRLLAGRPSLARLGVALERRLRRLVGRAFPRAGISGRPPHPDHQWIADVVSEHLAGTGVRLGYYAELPYARGGGGRRAFAALRARHRWTRVHRERVPIDREVKAVRVAAYRSQITQTSDAGTRLDDPAGLPPAETYWFVEPAE